MIVEKKPIYAKSWLKQRKTHLLCISRHIKTSICPSVTAGTVDPVLLNPLGLEPNEGDGLLREKWF